MKKNLVCGVLLGVIIVGASVRVVNAENNSVVVSEEKTQVLYGYTQEYGSVVVTDEGNEYFVVDAPEFEDGTRVYIEVNSDTNEVTYIDEIDE